jgi:hypothetical protein
MNCTEIRNRLLAWHYRELTPAEHEQVSQHLDDCRACRREAFTWQEFRRKLDAFHGPAVTVDLPRVYHAATERRNRNARRWRCVALTAMATAAAALVAVALKLEIRVEPAQLVLRWGGRPPAESASRAPMAVAPAPVSPVPAGAEDLALVKELVRVLAAEMQARDVQHREELAYLQTRFESLLSGALSRWASNERDVAALYASQFRLPKKGENP